MASKSNAQSRLVSLHGIKEYRQGKIFTVMNQGMRPWINDSASNYFYMLNHNEEGYFVDVTFTSMNHPKAMNLYVPFYVGSGIPVIVKTLFNEVE